MGDLTVFVAPAGKAAGIRDVLSDWSGAGLLDDFLWIEPAMVSGSRVNALSVRAGRLDGIAVASLAGVESFSRIRIAVIVPALTGESSVDPEVAQRIAQFFESAFGSTPVTRVRAVVTRADQFTTGPDLVIQGWHNIVLSPEESTGPGVGMSPLPHTTDAIDLGVQAAASLAGLLGLWSGISSSPLDAEHPPPGRVARLSRSYFRRLGTQKVEARLRRHVLSMRDGLPLPTQFGTASVYIDDTALATRTMADQLWSRHASVLQGPRETQTAAPARRIGVGEALRMLFGFLWAAIRNAPRAWLSGIVHSIKADAASLVQGAVFGSAPSAYNVVFKGVTSSGMPASWADLGGAARELDRVLEGSGSPRGHEARADLSTLWQDYAAGAMTLADAGERVSGLTPVQIGVQRGVLRRPSSAVPSVADAFVGIPPHLASTVDIDSVEPFDVLGIFSIEERLRAVADQPTMGVAASAAAHAVAEWKNAHTDSFASRVGTRIGERLYAVTGEIRSLLDIIRQAASADDLVSGVQATQKRLAKVIQVMAIVFAVAMVLVGVLFLGSIISATVAIVGAVSVLLVWFVSTVITFARGQRELFALINARRELLAGEELARRNLVHALRDARRLADAYSQFLSWSRILGTVLSEPFGREDEAETPDETAVADLPLPVRLGTAEVDEGVLASAAAEIRRDVFTVGWLTSSWESAIANAHHALGARGAALRAQPFAIFNERGDGDDTVLPEWAQSVTDDGIDPSIGDTLWLRIATDLEGPKQALASALLARVTDNRTPAGTSVSLDVFMGGVDRPGGIAHDRLDDSMLSDSARTSGESVVAQTHIDGSRLGLGRTATLTQLTAAFPEYELRTYAAAHSAARHDLAERAADPAPFDGLAF